MIKKASTVYCSIAVTKSKNNDADDENTLRSDDILDAVMAVVVVDVVGEINNINIPIVEPKRMITSTNNLLGSERKEYDDDDELNFELVIIVGLHLVAVDEWHMDATAPTTSSRPCPVVVVVVVVVGGSEWDLSIISVTIVAVVEGVVDQGSVLGGDGFGANDGSDVGRTC